LDFGLGFFHSSFDRLSRNSTYVIPAAVLDNRCHFHLEFSNRQIIDIIFPHLEKTRNFILNKFNAGIEHNQVWGYSNPIVSQPKTTMPKLKSYSQTFWHIQITHIIGHIK